VEFHVADMKAFRLSTSAAVGCNSINQALTPEAQVDTAYSGNTSTRWFLFDVVLEAGYARSWHADEVVTRDGRVCELAYRYDERARLAVCHVTVRDAAAKSGPRSYEFFQRPHSLCLLQKKLHQSGFDYVQVSSADGLGRSDGRVAVMARRGQELIRRLDRPLVPTSIHSRG
jgi:hypothetical protein